MSSEIGDRRGKLTRKLGQGREWPWLVVGVGALALKADAVSGLLAHRAWLIVILALGLVSSVLRTRLVGVALTAGPLLAFALAPGSTALGIALGIGAWALLLTLFSVVGAVLMARQEHGRAGPGELGPPPTGTVTGS